MWGLIKPAWAIFNPVLMKLMSTLAVILTLTACADRARSPSFDSVAEEFVYGTLALSPVSATQAGYHQRKGASLDEALDDFSAEGIASQRRFYGDFQARLEKWD